jgi:hypothetical protein
MVVHGRSLQLYEERTRGTRAYVSSARVLPGSNSTGGTTGTTVQVLARATCSTVPVQVPVVHSIHSTGTLSTGTTYGILLEMLRSK